MHIADLFRNAKKIDENWPFLIGSPGKFHFLTLGPYGCTVHKCIFFSIEISNKLTCYRDVAKPISKGGGWEWKIFQPTFPTFFAKCNTWWLLWCINHYFWGPNSQNWNTYLTNKHFHDQVKREKNFKSI